MRINSFNTNFGTARNVGSNPPAGVIFNYYVKDISDSARASVKVLDKDHKEIKTFSTDAKENNSKLDIAKGINQFAWNMKYPETDRIEGMILWNGTPEGITAPPGNYFARFKVAADSVEVPFIIKPDPNYKETTQEYEEQFNFLIQVKNKFAEV